MGNNNFLLQKIWGDTLALIGSSGQVPEDVLGYFSGSQLADLDGKKARILVPGFIYFVVMNDFKTLIQDCLQKTAGSIFEIEIEQENKVQPEKKTVSTNMFLTRDIDKNQTFENFVIGRSNLQAQVAAFYVANNPGVIYNPLFIYGSSGIGKTHLLNAIGNKVRELYPDKVIGFLTASDFVDDVFKAKKENAYDELKDEFRNVDLLLVDDVQFLANKTKSHELFFTIFNELVNNRKQIVVTSDQSPDDIKGLEERLVTRFNQGLTVNIVAPEYETAVDIVKMKIKNNITISQQIDDDVITYIATNFSQDVRSLEGAINRLLFYSINWSEDKDHISMTTAIDAFKDQIAENNSELSITKIKKVVCDYYHLNKQQLIGSVRTKNIANARHIAIYLCRKLLDAPYDKIGAEFGGRDHSTIINSCRKIEKMLKTDTLYMEAIRDLEIRLK